MTLFKKKLIKLTGRSDVPSRYQMIGDILILNKEVDDEIVEAIRKIIPAKTICARVGEIKGEFRTPQIKKLWGNGFETIHKEHGCLFKLDVSKIMWAKGNINERKRIASLVKENEKIIDMFAGIGYFSIPIAVYNPSTKIISIEKNPVAYNYLLENIKLNKVKNITPILGDSKIETLKFKNWATRIIMGYLPEPKEFLDSAFYALDEGYIHYEGIRKKGEEETLFLNVKKVGEKNGYKCKLEHIEFVKSYKPKEYHIVVDVFCQRVKQL